MHRHDGLSRDDTMQYITQFPLLAASSQRRFRENNYLLSQVVKEQPIDASVLRLRRSIKQTRTRDCLVVPREVMLVEPIGIEPMTSCLQSRRSPS